MLAPTTAEQEFLVLSLAAKRQQIRAEYETTVHRTIVRATIWVAKIIPPAARTGRRPALHWTYVLCRVCKLIHQTTTMHKSISLAAQRRPKSRHVRVRDRGSLSSLRRICLLSPNLQRCRFPTLGAADLLIFRPILNDVNAIPRDALPFDLLGHVLAKTTLREGSFEAAIANVGDVGGQGPF